MSEQEPKQKVWRCKECGRPMKCLVCGETQGLFISADGPVCFNHLPPHDPKRESFMETLARASSGEPSTDVLVMEEVFINRRDGE